MRRRVFIRPPRAKDCATFLDAVRRSRSLHRKWVSPLASPQAYRRHLKRLTGKDRFAFFVVHRETKGLVGVCEISEIVRGSFRSGYLGYYAFADYAGQGLMKEGIRLTLRHAFGKLKLHRLEANIQPGNPASVALAKKCGFRREGYSRRYLKIAGRWRDHERWAILADDV